MTKPLLAIALAAMTMLTACGDHPVPARGPVLRRDHSEAMVSYCGKGCFTYIPESWSVTVQDMHNKNWVGTVDVEPNVYAECDRPKIWPDCWKNAR